MSPRPGNPPPYGSAHDLPSVVEMRQQLAAMKLVTLVVAREQRQNIRQLERDIADLMDLVDAFYVRLGERHWIFTDHLPNSEIKTLLDETTSPEEAEERLITVVAGRVSGPYWKMGLLGHEAMRARLHMIERARAHYLDEQWDSCALVLVTVMDGFVNDAQPAERRGLHTRDPDEMVAWDSLVGHHMGLRSVMPEFLRTFKKRRDDEVFELHRHGIVHGTVTSYNNQVVATKAWNMLEAVADWAAARTKEEAPPKPKPSWKEIFSQIRRQGEMERDRKNFEPWSTSSTDPGFSDIEVVDVATKFFQSWKTGRWALVASALPTTTYGKTPAGQLARTARDIYEHYPLEDFELTAVEFPQANAAVVRGTGSIRGKAGQLETRWLRVGPDGYLAHPDGPARWELAVFPPNTFIKDSPSAAQGPG